MMKKLSCGCAYYFTKRKTTIHYCKTHGAPMRRYVKESNRRLEAQRAD